MRARRTIVLAAALAAVGGSMAISGGTGAGAAGAVGFGTPIFVDPIRAGGEPLILHSSKAGDLVYSSHEGTTHLDRSGLTGPGSVQQFLCPGLIAADCYRNQVWIWTSGDRGKTWTLREHNLADTGFSDPDLTEDAGGSIYDTGIDLANDSVYSSQDGGVHWPHGTTNCNAGDRPWLAGGKAGEVFMITDTGSIGHALFHSSNSADSCDGSGLDDHGIADNGTLPSGTNWSGFGKGLYDHFDGSFIEPAQFTVTVPGPLPVITSTKFTGVGISRLPNASSAFPAATATFQPLMVVPTSTPVFSPFGAPNVLSMDSAENLYFAWDADQRQPGTNGGCSATIPNVSGTPDGAATPLANHIMFVAGIHDGPGHWHFLPPLELRAPNLAGHVEWPWSVAGSPGNVSVVWYQMDTLLDPDCDGVNGTSFPDAKTYIEEAHIINATDPATRTVTITNASGRFIHKGGICNSGTTCALTGQDRRLGDYFTNAIDGNGCVMIASGDTTQPDTVTGLDRITSLPIFIQQNSGPSLTGQDCGAVAATTASAGSQTTSGGAAVSATPNTGGGAPVRAPVLAALLLGGAGVAAARRRGRRRARAVRG